MSSTPEQIMRERLTAQLGARPATFHFGKYRSIPRRQVHALTFVDQDGREQSWACCVRQDATGEWHFEGGAGGGIGGAGLPRGYPWANLGGGGWPVHFYAGGRVEENDGQIVRVRLRSESGLILEDTAEDSIVLFVTDDEVRLPLSVELLDARGAVVSQHRWGR